MTSMFVKQKPFSQCGSETRIQRRFLMSSLIFLQEAPSTYFPWNVNSRCHSLNCHLPFPDSHLWSETKNIKVRSPARNVIRRFGKRGGTPYAFASNGLWYISTEQEPKSIFFQQQWSGCTKAEDCVHTR